MTAVIRRAAPSTESDRVWYESRCLDCGTHEGLFTVFDHPRLLELRDRHNEALHPIPGPDKVPAVDASLGAYGELQKKVADLEQRHALQLQDVARSLREYRLDRDLIADAKQRADQEVRELLGTLVAVDELWTSDREQAHRILSRALAKHGLR